MHEQDMNQPTAACRAPAQTRTRTSFAGGRLAPRLAAGLALALAVTGVFAQGKDSPVGLWKNIDDETKQPKALIRIVETDGVLSGKIEKILTDKPDAVCDKCEGDLKDKPVQGMQILAGLKKGEEWYEGGTILDPNNGKVYRSKLKLIDGGGKLQVRGFIGVSLLGRTQTWVREQ
jgi:uncharacterized protein (DUF2147 family)